jgi:predicted Zn-dependent peptidase
LAEVYSDPSFLEREVETYVLKSQQEMLVNQEKVSYLASKAFSATLFGAQHPYGRSAEVSDYEKLNRGRLIDFHQRHIHNALNYILVSGKLNDQTLVELNTHFGQASRSTHEKEIIKIGRSEKHLVHVEKADAVQNAIRMGRVLFARTHADYVGMQMLCTVLGGYFGSRLMANIREDKGYTYGINAGMVSLKNSGHLSISTEVGASVCDAAINEIHFEIERIRKDLIPTQELELVRNYMLGSILKSIDGPFNIASKWKGYIKHDLGLNAHHDLIRQVRTMTPEQLRILANKYLQKDELILITAGRSN